ncbi:MAG TPA: cyclic nucleotide-binding domain-containing protein [Burkholderiales bacterium]|nr:cyclic nucleotide-binding domain-containing protein [Burkholderiales bacterium]
MDQQQHDVRRMLEDTPIFGGLKASTLAGLLSEAASIEVREGAFFFREGEAADAMFVLEQGRGAVLKRWQAQEYRIAELACGDCFGEMALIDLQPRSASVMAVEDSRALRVTPADLYRVYEIDIEQFALIHMNIARELSRRLRWANERAFRHQLEVEASSAMAMFCT